MRGSVAVMLVLVFLTASCLIFAKPVVSSSAIIIREDGSIEGTNKIQRIGEIYTFTGDIDISGGYTYSGIQVLKDNIMIDGAHLSINTQESGNIGIDLSGRTNVIELFHLTLVLLPLETPQTLLLKIYKSAIVTIL